MGVGKPRRGRKRKGDDSVGAPQEMSQGDALAAIAADDPGALKLVGDIMRRNADEVIFSLEGQIESKDREIESLNRRLREEVEHNEMVSRRLLWVLGIKHLRYDDLGLEPENY